MSLRSSMQATLALLILATIPSFADTTTIYVSADDSNLYTIDPTTGATTLIGSTGVEMTDIAFQNGLLFGVDFPGSGNSSLYSINPSTGASTKIGTDTGAFLNSLQFGPGGVLYAAGGSPFCGSPAQADCDSFFTLNTSTGVASLVGTGTYNASGDLEFVNNTLYLTSETSGTDESFTVDPFTGVGTPVGDTTFTEVFGLAFVPESNTLYGFNDVGNNVIAINPTTGVGSSVANYSSNFEILGAATDTVPEPRGTSAVLGLAVLIGFLGVQLKRGA